MSQILVTGEAKIRDIQGPVVANSGVITALDGAANQYVRGDGTLAIFPTSSGGGSSVSYYLNGSVNQGTFGGSTYYQMSRNAIVGTGTNFSTSSDGLIAQFITDANDPDVVSIPSGNWNVEFFMSVSASSGALASFYVEIYKYNGSTFTLLATNVATPEQLTNTTTVDAYFTSVAMPLSAMAVTDRLAVRVFANVASKTVTLYTEDNRLCQIVTTFSNGLTSLNNLTDQSQYLTTGTSGTDFNIVSSGDTHTFNIPNASATNRGLITTGSQTIAGAKVFDNPITANSGIGFLNGVMPNITSNLYSGIGGNSQGISIITRPVSTNYTNNFYFPSASNSYTFPNATGTIALTSDIPSLTGYVPYTGATANVVLGAFDLTARNLFFNTNTQTFKISNPVAVGSQGSNIFIGNGGDNVTYTSGDSGSYNTGVGFNAFSSITTGYRNVAFGQSAMSALTTGYFNVAIGDNAGRFISGSSDLITTANSSIFIGRSSQSNANGNTNEIVIGNEAVGNGSNSTTLGNSSITKTILAGNLLLGTTTDNGVNKLQVTGSAIISSSITASSFIKSGGTSSQFLKADGSTTTLTNIVTGAGTNNLLAYWDSSSSISSLDTSTYPSLTEISYVKGVTSSIQTQLGNKQGNITLTTTGTSGAATFVGNTLNIPNYGSALSGYVTIATNQTITGAKTFSSDITGESNIYVTFQEGGIYADNFGRYSTGSTPLTFLYGSTGSVLWGNGGVKMTLTSAGALQLASSLSATSGTFSSTVRPSSNYAADLGTSSIRWSSIFAFESNFAGSVTSQVNNISADGAGVVLQGYVDNSLRIAVRGSGYNSGSRGNLLANSGDFSSTVISPLFRVTSSGTFRVNTNADAILGYMLRSGVWKGNSENNLGFATDGPYAISFFTNGSASERMIIDTDGAILVGATALPSASISGVALQNPRTLGATLFSVGNVTDGRTMVQFINGNGVVGSIVTNGSTTTYNITSDYRLKQDLKDFNALHIISSIKTYDYEWKSDNTRMYGVIAHELAEVLPYAVHGEKDAKEMQGVDYSKIVPILVKSIQELEARIKQLENK